VSGVPTVLVRDLLAASLAAWDVAGSVGQTSDGAIVIIGKKEIRIESEPEGSVFRWTVIIDRRRRRALSLLAVLRQVRDALDPDFAASGVRVAVSPLVPS
jgi:transposase InsO family protein